MSRFRPLPSQAELKELLHYDPDTGVFTWKVHRSNIKAATVAGIRHIKGYIDIQIHHRKYKAHRLAWRYITNEDPGNMTIDHINRIRDDNRYCNLRKATARQQMGNTGHRSDNTSGFPGGSWYKRSKKWFSRIQLDNEEMHLGYYSDITDAKLAYSIAAEACWGEFMPPHARAFLDEHRDAQAHSAT